MAKKNKITDLKKSATKTANKLQKKPRGIPLAKGFDARRWIHGRPKITPAQKEMRALFAAVGLKELARVIKNTKTGEENEAIELMWRSMLNNKNTHQFVVEFFAGKVSQTVDVTSKGESIIQKVTDEEYQRTLSSLAHALDEISLGEAIPGAGSKADGSLDSTKL